MESLLFVALAAHRVSEDAVVRLFVPLIHARLEERKMNEGAERTLQVSGTPRGRHAGPCMRANAPQVKLSAGDGRLISWG